MVQRTSKAGDFTGKKLELPSQNESKKIMKKSASMKLSDVDDIARQGKKLISNSSPKLEGRTTTVTVMKSKAIELSDVDGLISLPQMGSLTQPGKPPTPMAVEVGVLSKSRESKASPNYMKSTSCFDARKDSKKARGSSNASPSYMKSASCSDARKDSICDKNQAGRSFKNSKPDQYGMRLARSSSLKLGRNLTKSASFKQTGSLNKSLPKAKAAALCSDIHAQRATCSSLLKDSKSPSYVMLNSGATESNGTSVMKVCTYKYCSLNGHHHAVMPPLKSFVSARRQSLKNQKSVKLKEHEDGTEGKRWAGSDFRVGEGVDFCVDIYYNGKEEVAELTLDGADHEDGDGLKYIEKASDDLEGEETDAADGVEAESESGNCCDGSVEAEDENSFEEENGESPLLATSSAERTFEAENDEELYDSIWEAYEMELQEFEFIEARLDDQVYVSVAAEDKIAEKENVEDDQSYANCAGDALIELNEENYDQKENKDKLLEYPASEMDQGHIQQDQYVYVLTDSDAESENRISDGDGDQEGSLSADHKVNRNEDEEHVTEKSEGNDVFVSPDNAEGTCDADTYDDSTINNSTSSKAENASFDDKMTSNQEQHSETSSNCVMKITKCKAAEDSDGQKGFNPQEPNYLPLEPEAKGEQVDLRHQDIEERKNSEEWMVDYALQKTVNQLAPVKRKKVELLVEAFETVAPTSKPDRRARRASFPLANTRSIQACN